MPVYRYSNTVALKEDENAILRVAFGELGSTAHHVIDIPGPNDKQALDQCVENLGTLDELAKERTLIYTKAVNINPNSEDVKLKYFINEQEVANHSNPKNVDPSPLIIVTLRFIPQ